MPFDQNKHLALSGLNTNNPEGNWYGYEIMPKEPISHNFCSYDCAHNYVKKNNKIIFTSSIIEKKRKGFIVPNTEEINHDLNNNISHRPSFLI